MKVFWVKTSIVLIGIGAGIFISSNLNLLNDIVSDSMVSDNNYVSNVEVDTTNKNDLILVNNYYDGFIIDLKYATKENITGTILYDSDLMYLQRNTVDKLIKVNEELKTKGYKLKIWDAYRPLSVQKKLWAELPNANFIANPFTTGSNHNRGAAVDVTLVYLNGKEVEMPTGFDEFGAECRRDYNWSDEVQNNVDILTETMLKYGFTSINSEWWHFDDEDCKDYPLMDYKFRDLIKK